MSARCATSSNEAPPVSRRLAVFDVCDTLIDFQTADRFVDFVLEGRWTFGLRLRNAFRELLHRARLLTGERHKRVKLALLTGVPEPVVRERGRAYVEEVLLPRLRPEIRDALLAHKAQGDFTVLASGGYDVYLAPLGERLGADRAIGTAIRFQNGACAGTFDGPNCMSEEKRRLIERAIPLSDFDLPQSTAYSDSPSDLPLLNAVGKGVIVARQESVSWNPGNRHRVLVVR